MKFKVNRLPADDSHLMSRLYLLFLKNQQNLKISSAANYRWRFKVLIVFITYICLPWCVESFT